MNRRVAFFISLLLFLSLTLSLKAQKPPTEAARDTSNYPYWIEMMQDPNANFYATVRAFEQYWEGRDIQKGNGWKPFKRWESFMQTRIKEDGSKPAPDEVWNAYWKAQKGKSPLKTTSTSNANWTEIGPTYLPANGTGQPNGVGRLNGIGFHPTNANTFYVGAPQGGVWKTTDGGLTWSSTTDALPTLGVSSILVDYNTPNTVYIGTGDRDAGDAPGLGVMKSTDSGDTWVSSNTGMNNKTVGMMVMHPTNPSIILAATSGGIYKTINGGTNWTLEQSGNFKDIEYKPSDPNIAYATASGNFYRSTNGGDSWTQLGTLQGIPSANRMVIAVTPANPNYVYVLASNSSTFKALYRSTDSGASFTTQSTTPNIMDYSTDGSGSSGQAWYDLCLAADPNNANTIYAGGVNIFKSTNGGANWTLSAHWVGSGGADDIHADQHALEFSPVNDYLYSGNDGGVYFTSDNGTIWTDRSSGLGIAQVYKIGQSATVKDLVINGYQDNGTAVYDGAWRTEIGGDGMECIIDYTDSNYQYGALYYGDMRRSTNNGVSFSQIAANGTNGITESGAWITPYALHETDPNTMFIGYRNIWRSTNVKAANSGSVAWTKITSTNSTVYVVEPSPANTNILYYVTNSVLYRIDNVMAASPTVVDLNNGLPTSGTPTDIEAHPTNENIVYMTLSNNVYKSTNKGASWTDISDNIPNINTNCLVYQIGTDEGLYVGTDAGVYYKDNTLNDWVVFDENLPVNSEVTELEIYYDAENLCESRIRASTYGRGLWESTLQNSDEFIAADFRASSTESCTGSSILFEDSSCNASTYQWTFSPSTVTYTNGTSATSANPEVQFNAAGTYSVNLSITGTLGNDTKTINNYITINQSTNLPLSTDFENVNACGTSSDCGATVCNLNLSNNWFNETNGVADNIDWRANSNGTPSGSTGPSADHTTGNSTGTYLYLEASSGCFGQTALLTSPCLSIPSGTTELRFWYHAYGFSMGSLHVDALESSGWNEDIANTVSGDQGNLWLEMVVDLSGYVGQTIKLRIRGVTGSEYASDLAIDDITIQNTPPTGIVASFTASTTQGCQGTMVNFTDTSTGTPTAWSWNFAGGTPSTSNLQNPSVTYNTEGTYTVSLTATNAGSNNTLVKQSHITIFAPPTANITGDLQICQGESTTLTASGGGSYLWNTGSNNAAINVSPTQNTSYSVVVTDANGCTDSQQVSVNVNAAPTANIAGNLDICENESTTLTASGGGSYLWNTGSNNAAITVSPTQNTSYSVIVTNANGCTDSQQVSVNVGTGTNCCETVVSIEYENTNALPPCVTASDYITAGNYGAGNTVIGSSQQVHFSAGNYISFDPGFSVEQGGVLSTTITTIPTTTSPNEAANLKKELDTNTLSNHLTQLWIYPNPFADATTVTYQLFEEAEVSLNIYDMAGKKVESLINLQGQVEGTYKVRFESCNLQQGVYLCVLEVDGERKMSKLLKQ
ncbi:MAG: PKD domain-containing protein [Chitinophagales bacterium]